MFVYAVGLAEGDEEAEILMLNYIKLAETSSLRGRLNNSMVNLFKGDDKLVGKIGKERLRKCVYEIKRESANLCVY